MVNEVVTRRSDRTKQCQHVLVRLDLGRRGLWIRQSVGDVAQAQAKPGIKPIAQSVDLAMTGSGRERDGVEVVQNDFPARSTRVGSVSVNFQAGARHLLKFVRERPCPAILRMAVL